MFINIMSGVINEVTRQPASPATPPHGARHGRKAGAAGRRPRAAPRTAPATPARATMPRKYRVLAESFRRAAGFQA